MKKTWTMVGVAMLLAGCFSVSAPVPTDWTIETSVAGLDLGAFGTVRPASAVSRVTVRAPYDGTRLVVLRADGSIAFDAYNMFAAKPATLLKGMADDVLGAGKPEITVLKLALDCRDDSARMAIVALVLDGKVGTAAVDTADGDYSRAFSQAFANALAVAVKGK